MPLHPEKLIATLDALPPYRIFGRVTAVQGLLIEVAGVERHLSVGGRCVVGARGNRHVLSFPADQD